MSATAASPDWAGWLERWEAQQGGYMPDREQRFGVIVDTVAAVCGDEPHVVDLGCGPGSLARRVLARLPGARVTAIDMDPVLLEIGRNALGDQDGRLRWIDADLRDEWTLDAPADAAVSTTALHWLQPDALAALYGRLAEGLRPGGVFVNGDSMGFPAGEQRLAEVAHTMRERRAAPANSTGESWEEWWDAVAREPALAAAVAERGRRHHDHPDHDHPLPVDAHARLLRDAGFAEADTVWQHLADRVLVAIR